MGAASEWGKRHTANAKTNHPRRAPIVNTIPARAAAARAHAPVKDVVQEVHVALRHRARAAERVGDRGAELAAVDRRLQAAHGADDVLEVLEVLHEQHAVCGCLRVLCACVCARVCVLVEGVFWWEGLLMLRALCSEAGR